MRSLCEDFVEDSLRVCGRVAKSLETTRIFTIWIKEIPKVAARSACTVPKVAARRACTIPKVAAPRACKVLKVASGRAQPEPEPDGPEESLTV